MIKKTKVECDGKFLIKSISAIELGLIFWAIYEDKSKIQKIQELVNKFSDLEPWKHNIDDVFNSFEMTRQILQLFELIFQKTVATKPYAFYKDSYATRGT